MLTIWTLNLETILWIEVKLFNITKFSTYSNNSKLLWIIKHWKIISSTKIYQILFRIEFMKHFHINFTFNYKIEQNRWKLSFFLMKYRESLNMWTKRRLSLKKTSFICPPTCQQFQKLIFHVSDDWSKKI